MKRLYINLLIIFSFTVAASCTNRDDPPADSHPGSGVHKGGSDDGGKASMSDTTTAASGTEQSSDTTTTKSN